MSIWTTTLLRWEGRKEEERERELGKEEGQGWKLVLM